VQGISAQSSDGKRKQHHAPYGKAKRGNSNGTDRASDDFSYHFQSRKKHNCYKAIEIALLYHAPSILILYIAYELIFTMPNGQ
jgi:hypothetical protein